MMSGPSQWGTWQLISSCSYLGWTLAHSHGALCCKSSLKASRTLSVSLSHTCSQNVKVLRVTTKWWRRKRDIKADVCWSGGCCCLDVRAFLWGLVVPSHRFGALLHVYRTQGSSARKLWPFIVEACSVNHMAVQLPKAPTPLWRCRKLCVCVYVLDFLDLNQNFFQPLTEFFFKAPNSWFSL